MRSVKQSLKCPDCGAKLHVIQRGEWCCDNSNCPANNNRYDRVYSEYYGYTQVEINKQQRIKGEKNRQ